MRQSRSEDRKLGERHNLAKACSNGVGVLVEVSANGEDLGTDIPVPIAQLGCHSAHVKPCGSGAESSSSG